MRMPNSKEMSKEQKKIYLDAPIDGSVLVTGPPGTGKTVIAFLRAQTAEKLDEDASVVMYNRVLSSYTGNLGEEGFEVLTLHQWVYRWWKGMKPDVVADGEPTVYILDCPFDEKDEAKELGARWDRNKRKWYVSTGAYKGKKEQFACWNPRPGSVASGYGGAPNMPEDRFQFDWDKILEIVVSQGKEGKISLDDIHWGHLIIDEAQDFSPQMFESLRRIAKILFKDDPDEERPALTIFADQNQRLQEKTNSTIDEIRVGLNLPKKSGRIYSLTRNYRNTVQIAKLAFEFYVGLPTGKPDLPVEEGDLPLLVKGGKLNDSVDYIYRYALNHDNEEIGVITQNNKVRRKFVNRLASKLDGNSSLRLQSYASRDKDWGDSRDLVFDEGGVITVVNKQSCKGLEFDAVFLPELQSVSVAPDDKDQFKMEMYVMTSRARHMLALMYSNEGDETPAILSYLPDEESGLMEYTNAG